MLGSRIKSTGDNKEAVLDKYKDDLSKLKSNSRLNSLFIASILILPAVVAVQSIEQSLALVGQRSIDQIFFANSVAIASYYVFNFVFMLLFGLMTIASLLDGQIFKFLHTLPLSKSEIQVLGIMSFIRLLLFQLIIMLLVFPLGIFWVTGSAFVFGMTFLMNVLNLILGSYLLIIIIDKMKSLLFSQNHKFGLKSLFRYLFFVVYILVAFSIYFFVGNIGNLLETLYVSGFLPQTTIEEINTILPFVAFPFTTGYIISIFAFTSLPTQQILISALIGLGILLLMTYLVVRSGNRILLNMAYKNKSFSDKEEKDLGEIKITTTKALYSYIKLNLLIVSRDLSSMISLTMAILFPLLPLLQGMGQDLFITFLFYSGFIVFFSANALSVSEGSVGGLLSSLPFSHKSMLRGKQMLIAVVYLVAYGILSIASGFSAFSIGRFLVVLLLSILLPNVFLIAKSRLFGYINGEYTLFDIEDNNNFFRNFVLIIPIMVVVGIEYALFFMNQFIVDITGLNPAILVVVVNLLLLLILETGNHVMFGGTA